MRRCIFLLIVVASSTFAQEPTAVFKSRTELVLVPTVVTRDGQPVTGLKPTDFILLHQGVREDIGVFEEINATVPPLPQPPLPANAATNFGRGETSSDTFIVLLDFLNGRWDNAARIRAYTRDFAKLFADTHTRVAVLLLTAKGLVQIHSFTSDPGDLLSAVDAWAKKGPRPDSTPDQGQAHQFGNTSNQPRNPLDSRAGPLQSEWTSTFDVSSKTGTLDDLNNLAFSPSYSDQLKLDRAAMTTQALEQLSAAFGGIPGRKRLVWVSTGFPTVNDIDVSAEHASYAFDIQDKIVRAWQALSTNNIVVYPVDSSGGAVNPLFDRAGVPNTASMLEVAERTGGRTCVDLLNNCMARTLAADRHYYLLGFYLHGDQKPGWHKLKLELNGQKAQIHARTGFVIGDEKTSRKSKDKEQSIERDIVMTALASPLDYTGVPLTVQWKEVSPKDKARFIELQLASPPGGVVTENPGGRMDLNYLAFIRPIGKTEGQSYPATLAAALSPAQQNRLMQSGFFYRKQIPITPGNYELRVFLRDNVSGKIGTVSTTVSLK